MELLLEWLHAQEPDPLSLTWLARQLVLSKNTVKKWGKIPIPAKHCLAIQRLTDGQITVHDLRPDVFGVGQDAA